MIVSVASRGAGAALVALLLAACSGGSGGSSPTTESTAPTPTFVGDGSPFCNAMLDIGQVAGAQGATPKEVLAANEQLVAQLDEAQANTPPDAPPDFDALVDDYRVATTAIFDAKGDVAKAFKALETEQPEVVARLGSSTSHKEAYDFLVERCGINAP
ncbi:MAG: hypothetical protein ACJ739_00845 [Acidimicrobiales bacterium]